MHPDLYKQTNKLYRGHRHSVEFILSSESYIASASIAGYVKVWNTESNQCVMEVSPIQRYFTNRYHVRCSCFLLFLISYTRHVPVSHGWFMIYTRGLSHPEAFRKLCCNFKAYTVLAIEFVTVTFYDDEFLQTTFYVYLQHMILLRRNQCWTESCFCYPSFGS